MFSRCGHSSQTFSSFSSYPGNAGAHFIGCLNVVPSPFLTKHTTLFRLMDSANLLTNCQHQAVNPLLLSLGSRSVTVMRLPLPLSTVVSAQRRLAHISRIARIRGRRSRTPTLYTTSSTGGVPLCGAHCCARLRCAWYNGQVCMCVCVCLLNCA